MSFSDLTVLIMCRNCVKSPYPYRDRMCLEKGAYLFNLGGCSQCRMMELLEMEKVEEEVEGQETVSYKHVCTGCQHIVSEHKVRLGIQDLDPDPGSRIDRLLDTKCDIFLPVRYILRNTI